MDYLWLIFVLAVIFLGEKLTVKIGIGAALIAAGAIIIALG